MKSERGLRMRNSAVALPLVAIMLCSCSHRGDLKTPREVELQAQCETLGQPREGMTYDQVLATCWGKPASIHRTTTTRGHVQEQDVYPEHGYIYLDDGIVTSIQTL
jgi:hypothetical protein